MAHVRVELELTDKQAKKLSECYEQSAQDQCCFCDQPLPASRTPFITTKAHDGKFYFVALLACLPCGARINKAAGACRSIILPS